jgi:class 3 adenylate cyclase
LRRYLAPQVADAVLSGGAPVSLTSTRRNLSILVAKIRGFSSMSEGMEPEEVIDALNQHFAVMTDVAHRRWRPRVRRPIPFEDHAGAPMTALEMRQRLRGLRGRWSTERDGGLDVGIGVSTGYVTVGNIGSATRTEYTVIGNHVNLATHLAQMAGPDQIQVSERTLSASAIRERVDATSLDTIQMDGFRAPWRFGSPTAHTAARPDAAAAQPNAAGAPAERLGKPDPELVAAGIPDAPTLACRHGYHAVTTDPAGSAPRNWSRWRVVTLARACARAVRRRGGLMARTPSAS